MCVPMHGGMPWRITMYRFPLFITLLLWGEEINGIETTSKMDEVVAKPQNSFLFLSNGFFVFVFWDTVKYGKIYM